MSQCGQIDIFGIVHQQGGCGTEALGAIELLRMKGVAVRCIVPPGDQIARGPAADYLRSIGVSVTNYTSGMFRDIDVLVSFAEGHKLFPLIRNHNDRPGYVAYSDCMHYASDDEIGWHAEGLIDAFFFQSKELADRLGPQIVRRAKRSLNIRHGYRAYISPASQYFPLRMSVDRDYETFTAIKVCRDDPDKWHSDSWRMFCGINAPASRKVQIEIAGWGPNALEKIGDVDSGPWKGEMNVKTHDLIENPKDMAALYNRAHVLVHVCGYEWEEALGRVILEAMLSGVVVVADDRGGACHLIRHGQTGFLVNSPDEASFYASKLAFDDNLRRSIAAQARIEIMNGHASISACWPWWRDLINSTQKLSTPLN